MSPPSNALEDCRVFLGEAEFNSLSEWPFRSDPFYEGQVPRLLKSDIAHRLANGPCRVWAFRNSANELVGFGCLDICQEYSALTRGKDYIYIPLLAVHPQFQGRGYGRTIVEFLISQAQLLLLEEETLSGLLLLDVYEENIPAVALYQKYGFEILNPSNPSVDANEGGELYFIMGKKLITAHDSNA